MHTPATALETLTLLWDNYCDLAEHRDVSFMSGDAIDWHVSNNTPLRPLRVAAGLARQGFISSAWFLWESYAIERYKVLGATLRKKNHESTVDWVGLMLDSVGQRFVDREWFRNASSLRNLIAHAGGRVETDRDRLGLEQSKLAFSGIETWKDNYLALEHEHVAELKERIHIFICRTRNDDSVPAGDSLHARVVLGSRSPRTETMAESHPESPFTVRLRESIAQCLRLPRPYNPSDFRRAVDARVGDFVPRAKQMLREQLHDGLVRLTRGDALHLSMEWIIVNEPEWHGLFTDEERKLAASRLELARAMARP